MQGKKDFTPRLFYSLSLDSLVPQDDFYRQLGKAINLSFLYPATKKYYGTEGQESIDPVVFFKICMVGYLNNLYSDRALIRFCSNSLNIRLFLGYDLDEALPWHSTISRTRQLLGEEVFLSLFQKVLSLCVEKDMVAGRRQAMDSAFIKANASMDSLIEKEILDDVETYANELNENSEYKITSAKKKQVEQHHAWKKKACKDRPGGDFREGRLDEDGNEIRPKFLSNHTHYSPTDPDARISTKPGKPRNLNYFGQVSVDTAHHVIIGACADFADQRDSQCIEKITGQTLENLGQNGLTLDELLADTGYSSGEALKYLEEKGINAWIPNFGQYKPEREGFIFNKDKNQFECQRGNRAILPYKNTRTDRKHRMMIYRSSERDCKNCPLRTECCGEKTKFKKISQSEHHQYYERMHEKRTTHERYAKRMSKLRSKTVEPVLGTLINFGGMKRINTRGIAQAGKHVLMAALCYNLKKYLKFTARKVKSITQVMGIPEQAPSFSFFDFLQLILVRYKLSYF